MTLLTKLHFKGRSSVFQDGVKGSDDQIPPQDPEPGIIHYYNSRERFLLGKLGSWFGGTGASLLPSRLFPAGESLREWPCRETEKS